MAYRTSSATQEDHRSEDEDIGSNILVPQSQQEEQPMITTETTFEPLPSSQESPQEPPILEGDEMNIETVKETICALRKEITNLTYQIIRADHHHQFAQRCGEKEVIPAGLDYTKNNVDVMKSPHDADKRRFQETITHIQRSASKLTMETMENYYEQLTTTLQTKLGQTYDQLSQCMQQLKELVTEEEWEEKRQTHEEFRDSLSDKQDKLSDKLTNKRANKLEILQNPRAKPHPRRKARNERTRNEHNKGKNTHKKNEGRKQKPSTGSKNNRNGEQKAPRQDTHQQATMPATPTLFFVMPVTIIYPFAVIYVHTEQDASTSLSSYNSDSRRSSRF